MNADLAAALELGEFDKLIAVKRSGIALPMEYWAWIGLHPEMQQDFNTQRIRRGLPLPEMIVAQGAGNGVKQIYKNYTFPEMGGRCGSSGWFAVKFAYDMGFEKIVICGMGMQREGGRIDGRTTWESAQNYRNHTIVTHKRLNGIVKSMSGWTAEKLGRPDEQWLASEGDLKYTYRNCGDCTRSCGKN